MSETRERLESEKAQAQWKDLRYHFAKDTLIIVSNELDLIDVGEQIAFDKQEQIAQWIEDHSLRKPSAEEAQVWEKNIHKPFWMVIVQPFVLIQETQSV